MMLFCTARMIRQHIDLSLCLPRSAIVRFAIGYGSVDSSSFLHVYFRSCCLSALCSAIEIPTFICLPFHHSCCSCPLLTLNSGNSGVATSLLGCLVTRLADLTEWLHLCRCIQHRVTLACRCSLNYINIECPAQAQHVHAFKMKTITAMAINFLVAAFTHPPNSLITPHAELAAQHTSSGSDPALVGWIDTTDGQCKLGLVLQQICNFLI